jgi:CRP-like cAMP-binding protein
MDESRYPGVCSPVWQGNGVGVTGRSGRQFSDGELIYRMGDPADGVYRVRFGGVRLQRGGDPVQLETPHLGADAVFGGDGFLTGETRETDAVAVGDVVVEFLRRNEFLAILAVQPNLLSPLFEPVFNLVRSAAAAGRTCNRRNPTRSKPKRLKTTSSTAPDLPPPI